MTQSLVKVDTFGMGVHSEETRTLIATFYLGGDLYGVDALEVQEIVRFQKMTPVPLAPDYVLGLINLRGQIVTTIDIAFRLTGKRSAANESCMNLILKREGQITNVLVDDVGDVLEVKQSQLEPPPETMDARLRKHVRSICKLDDRLMNILATERVIGVEKNEERV